jgi:hypothetical protein
MEKTVYSARALRLSKESIEKRTSFLLHPEIIKTGIPGSKHPVEVRKYPLNACRGGDLGDQRNRSLIAELNNHFDL